MVGLVRAPIADQALSAAMHSLAIARTRIHTFNVAVPYLSPHFDCALRNELMDFSALKVLKVRPGHVEDPGEQPVSASAFDSRIVEACKHILARSASTVETFECRGCEVFVWTMPSLGLSNLRTLTLGPSDVSASVLVSWITSSDKLERLTLDDVDLLGVSGQEWKEVFDCIRGHRNAIEVHFSPLYVFDEEIYFAAFRTKTPHKGPDAFAFKNDPDASENVKKALPLYMNGQLEWIDCLPQTFDA